METGEMIKKLRMQNHWTQEQLGEKLGVQKSAIAKYEKGRVENLKRSTIQKMAEIFNVSPLVFLGYEVKDKSIPLYSSLCCGKGLFINDNIEDYIAVPDRYINSNKEYFANIAKGDSMIGKGINDGDTLIFEKTNVLESGQIGSFCINDGNDCVCKIFRRLNNGMIVLESANPKYDPIIIDVTNECFRVIGKLVCKFSGIE